MAHDGVGAACDAKFIYANRMGLEAFDCSWGEWVGRPSRLSAQTVSAEQTVRVMPVACHTCPQPLCILCIAAFNGSVSHLTLAGVLDTPTPRHQLSYQQLSPARLSAPHASLERDD